MSPFERYTSGNVLPERLKIFVVETIKRAYVNENRRKQPAVIAIRAEDEEEVVDGPRCPLWYTARQKWNFLFLLSQRWEFIGQLLQMFL